MLLTENVTITLLTENVTITGMEKSSTLSSRILQSSEFICRARNGFGVSENQTAEVYAIKVNGPSGDTDSIELLNFLLILCTFIAINGSIIEAFM